MTRPVLFVLLRGAFVIVLLYGDTIKNWRKLAFVDLSFSSCVQRLFTFPLCSKSTADKQWRQPKTMQISTFAAAAFAYAHNQCRSAPRTSGVLNLYRPFPVQIPVRQPHGDCCQVTISHNLPMKLCFWPLIGQHVPALYAQPFAWHQCAKAGTVFGLGRCKNWMSD